MAYLIILFSIFLWASYECWVDGYRRSVVVSWLLISVMFLLGCYSPLFLLLGFGIMVISMLYMLLKSGLGFEKL